MLRKSIKLSALAALAIALIVVVSHQQQVAANDDDDAEADAEASAFADDDPEPMSNIEPSAYALEQSNSTEVTNTPLERLKRRVAERVSIHPNLYEPDDVDAFLHDDGPLAAERLLRQKGYKWRSASKLALRALRWRKKLQLFHGTASDFPCDLFTLGLIFEYGHAHHQDANGDYVEGNPVIWIRLGALGSIIKHLERLTPRRVLSFARHTRKSSIRHLRRAERREARREARRVARRGGLRGIVRNVKDRIVPNRSLNEHQTINHVLRAIAWWLGDWIRRNPNNAQATLVLDFENTDAAFASWSIGEFFVQLDDFFPDLFDQIIGFRYRPKLWTLHSPISMFVRIFKSRISSSPETDRKLKFVSTEPKISAYIPRVDSQGFTMLPEHVSGTCMGPDSTKAPAGCQQDSTADGLYDPGFWQAIRNEFYYACRTKPRNST